MAASRGKDGIVHSSNRSVRCSFTTSVSARELTLVVKERVEQSLSLRSGGFYILTMLTSHSKVSPLGHNEWLKSTRPGTPMLAEEPLFYTFVRGSFTTSVSTHVLTLVVKEPLTQSSHDVGAGHIWVVCWAPISAQCARVGVIYVTTMSMAVVPILPMLVGSGRAHGVLCTGTVATKPGLLLWETTTTVATTGTTVVVASAIASVTAIVESVLLLCRGIDVGRWLLADSHAELLDVH